MMGFTWDGRPFYKVMAEDIPDHHWYYPEYPDEQAKDVAPVFSETNLYMRMVKDDARFVMGIADEYAALLHVLGVERVKQILHEAGVIGWIGMGHGRPLSRRAEAMDTVRRAVAEARLERRDHVDLSRDLIYLIDVETDDGDFIDSCGGFYGSEHAEESAQEFAASAAEYVARERSERSEWEARGVVTV
jgi:hypothetical protein